MRLAAILGVLVALGCAAGSAIPVPGEADAVRARPGVTVEALRQGRERYVARCGGCHRLYPPDRVRRDEWPAVIERMKGLFPLPDGDARLIEDYLTTFAPERSGE